MPISTASDICTSALKEINVVAAGETPSSDESADALDALNVLLDEWRAQRLAIPYPQTRTTWTIVSGTASYTVGSGGDVNRARPDYINHVYYQDTAPTPDQEYPMDPLSDDAYAIWPQKALTSTLPSYWYYSPTYPTGTLYLLPIPTSSTLQGVMYAPTGLTDFAALTDSLSLPSGYKRALIKNLALDLALSYGREVGDLGTEARDTLQTVKALNLRMMDMRTEAAALGYSDLYGWSIRLGP